MPRVRLVASVLALVLAASLVQAGVAADPARGASQKPLSPTDMSMSGCWAACSSPAIIRVSKPTLRARVWDNDSDLVSVTFLIYTPGKKDEWGNPVPPELVQQISVNNVKSGTLVSVVTQPLSNGKSYWWQVQTVDEELGQSLSGPFHLTLDATPPAKPSVSSIEYPSDSWAGEAGTEGNFTVTAAGSGDVIAYEYGLDTDPPTSTMAPSIIGGSVTLRLTPPTDGPHTLYVQSRDKAGNTSMLNVYRFYVGNGGVTSPSSGHVAADTVALEGIAPAGADTVTYQWRRGAADPWTEIPAADVTKAVGGSVITWPVSREAGSFPKLNWDLAATLARGDAEGVPRDGPLQVRGIFSGAAAGPTEFVFDRSRAAVVATQVGPGAVNLVTGDFTLSVADVAAASADSALGLARTFATRRPDRMDPMFGSGWVSSVTVGGTDAGYTGLAEFGSLVQVRLADGTTLGFTKTGEGGGLVTFDPEPGAGAVSLSYIIASNTYRLSDGAGTEVRFTRVAGASTGEYVPTAVTPAGSAKSATYAWEKVTVNGAEVVRPTQALDIVPSGVNCDGGLVRGCRALSFGYATQTTASGTGEQSWGDYAGRLKEVAFTAWDPDADPPAMRTVTLARYGYDSDGQLRAAWDPRLDLRSTYGYADNGVLTSYRPAGQEPWQFSYIMLPGDPAVGRLAAVTRSALAVGTATTSIVYRVPVSGSGAPYDMSPAETARWGQAEAPIQATAVFPPNQVPDGDPVVGILPSSYERATISYLNANGQLVNEAAPGGYIAAVWLDSQGVVVRELSPRNRKSALDASATDDAAAEAILAAQLSTIHRYQGELLRETLGPEQDVALPTGVVVRGRMVTSYVYDEGAPAEGGPFDLVTTETLAVRHSTTDSRLLDSDARVAKMEYDWSLRKPTAVIEDPNGLALTTRTVYDSAGRVVSTTRPAGGGSTATPSTRMVTYYSAGANTTFPECGGRAEWAGLVCRTAPGGQPNGGPVLPVTFATYDVFGQPRTAEERTSQGIMRTVSTSYDAAGRVYESAITGGDGTGAAVPKQRQVYDVATGRLVRTQAVDAQGQVTAEVVRVYDTLGQLVSYTDADGNTSTISYDLLSRPVSTTDGKATRSYRYDTGTERRGLLTEVTDSQAGVFTASYDADGNEARLTWPNGVVVDTTLNEAGAPVRISYTKPDCGAANCVLYEENVVSTGHGQRQRRASTLSAQEYAYDAVGRLTMVRDIVAGQCTTRTFQFDAATNRTAFIGYSPAGDGKCQTTTPANSQAWSYDTADRTSTSGYQYDAMGRTTEIPAVDLANPAQGNVTIDYFVTDQVKSIAQSYRTARYQLDVDGRRIRSVTDTTGITVKVRRHHYAGDTDTPVWTDEGDGTHSRAIMGIGRTHAIYRSGSGLEWLITNLHGDFVAALSELSATLAQVGEHTESGVPKTATDIGDRRYGWLGSELRAADNPGGLQLMGARLYNPTVSRFQSVDPVYGGSANNYEYCAGDPVNCTDLSGTAVDCNPSWKSNYVSTVSRWSYWWSGRTFYNTRYTWGYTFNLRCRLSHLTTTWLLYAGTIAGGAIGGAIGAAVCSWLSLAAVGCAVIGGIIGAALGGLGPTLYSGYCTAQKGITVRATIYRRWYTQYVSVRWWWGGWYHYTSRWNSVWGYPMGPACNW